MYHGALAPLAYRAFHVFRQPQHLNQIDKLLFGDHIVVNAEGIQTRSLWTTMSTMKESGILIVMGI